MYFLSVGWNLDIELEDFLFYFTHTNNIIHFSEGKHLPTKGFPEYKLAYDSCQVFDFLYLGHTNGNRPNYTL